MSDYSFCLVCLEDRPHEPTLADSIAHAPCDQHVQRMADGVICEADPGHVIEWANKQHTLADFEDSVGAAKNVLIT